MPLFFAMLPIFTPYGGEAPPWPAWHVWTVVAVLVKVVLVFGRISTTVKAMSDIAMVGRVWCALAKIPRPRGEEKEPTAGVRSSSEGGSVVDGIFGGVGIRAGTVFVDVLVLVFGPGTTAVEAMPDSAMVKRTLGARANIAWPCDEGEEPAVGVFPSSGVVVSVGAGTGHKEIGKMAGPACWMLGLAFIRKDFFGWAAVMPR